MNWIRSLMDNFLHHSKARHVNRSPAKAAQARAESDLADAKTRRLKADVVVGSLERRVFRDNHISEGIARLWVGRT